MVVLDIKYHKFKIDPCKNGSGAVLQTIIGDQIISGEISGDQFGISTANLTGDITGVVVHVIVKDSGQGSPPPQTVPQYPAILELTGVTVTNPGFNYDPAVVKLLLNQRMELNFYN